MTTTFVTAAFCILDGDRLLTVRKAGSSRFQLPGGKIDPGETPRQAAVREALEEVGVDLAGVPDAALGRFHEVAANEPGAFVDATVFVAALPAGADPAPRAEIAEQRWLCIDDELPEDLAPLLARHVVPALRVHRARA
ncbi:NUDIX domain-containing protein [Intrasporangium sp.]|uniref:NUDIX hydrolase n=1 Tax=Intrasporangium sp. TaxID=1925024 RepID=UPI00293B3C72|nr:NUDIX domain-containing protein [Intrasporangium sp.]MDV3220809.1 NUDIX domain-containing protein [Intrasporangium sp.]